jgi:cobalt/nickel transport system permease protein
VPDTLLNPYRHRNSVMHRLPPALKLASALAFILAVVFAPGSPWGAYGVAGAALLLVALISQVPSLHLLKRLVLVEPFVLGIALLSLFQPEGWRVFLVILAKSTLCLFCMVLLAATTRFTDVLRVLWRLRAPPLLVTNLALTHRYLSVLFEEMARMKRARRSRTFLTDRWALWRASASVVAHLFVRTSERAERVYAAMCARGWKT